MGRECRCHTAYAFLCCSTRGAIWFFNSSRCTISISSVALIFFSFFGLRCRFQLLRLALPTVYSTCCLADHDRRSNLVITCARFLTMSSSCYLVVFSRRLFHHGPPELRVYPSHGRPSCARLQRCWSRCSADVGGCQPHQQPIPINQLRHEGGASARPNVPRQKDGRCDTQGAGVVVR